MNRGIRAGAVAAAIALPLLFGAADCTEHQDTRAPARSHVADSMFGHGSLQVLVTKDSQFGMTIWNQMDCHAHGRTGRVSLSPGEWAPRNGTLWVSTRILRGEQLKVHITGKTGGSNRYFSLGENSMFESLCINLPSGPISLRLTVKRIYKAPDKEADKPLFPWEKK
jgi:hypothetical protein